MGEPTSGAETTPAIEIDGLHHDYDGEPALRGLSMRIEPGEIVAYLGPNGSGKSTTMHLLTGRFPPSAGSLRVASWVGQHIPSSGPT